MTAARPLRVRTPRHGTAYAGLVLDNWGNQNDEGVYRPTVGGYRVGRVRLVRARGAGGRYCHHADGHSIQGKIVVTAQDAGAESQDTE